MACIRIKSDYENIDFCAPARSINKKFIVRISNESSLEEHMINVFTYGFISKEGVSGGSYFPEYGRNISTKQRSRLLEEQDIRC